jgi:hypothetical protein
MRPIHREGVTGLRVAGVLLFMTLCVLSAATASAQISALVSPGRLNRAHASLEGVGSCLSCHSAGRRIAAEKCLGCHKPVAERIAKKVGVHRQVTTDCIGCHVEHAGADAELRPFDQKSFAHASVTGFALDGLHAPLQNTCAACHKTRSFLTLRSTCESCHADAHKGALGPNCASCHTTAIPFQQTKTSFDHTRTKFPLTGSHVKAACASCHKNNAWSGVKFETCASCHADVHRQTFGASCAGCHTTAKWATTKVNHALTAFKLKGKHEAVACAGCHAGPAMKVAPPSKTCGACHADPHQGQFKQDCAACHTESGFRSGTFDHSTTGFPLVDRHATLTCVQCHTKGGGARGDPLVPSRPAVTAPAARAGSPAAAPPLRAPALVRAPAVAAANYRGLSKACASCHADVHRAELGTACETCHSARTFQVTAFTHRAQRAFFAGQHATLTCAKCHPPPPATARPAASGPLVRVGFTTTSSACASCHRDVHLGQVNAQCETCHSVETPKFGAPLFNHAGTRFPLTGLHAQVTCAGCHKVETRQFPSGRGEALRLTGIGTTCAACHRDVHLGQVSSPCESCHSASTPHFGVVGFKHETTRFPLSGKHAQAACDSCHKVYSGAFPGGRGETKRLTGIGTECASCHQDVHGGELPQRCEQCHTAHSFSVQKYTHQNARALKAFFAGPHLRTTCEACHKPERKVFGVAHLLPSFRTQTTCVSCHIDVHRGALGPKCETCHRL